MFTANAFALPGLRALFFLVTGLLDRLVYLSTGLTLNYSPDAWPPGGWTGFLSNCQAQRRRNRFKTIVLALDGSENSQRATPVAAELAKQNGGKIVIAHVEERIAAKGGADLYAR